MITVSNTLFTLCYIGALLFLLDLLLTAARIVFVARRRRHVARFRRAYLAPHTEPAK